MEARTKKLQRIRFITNAIVTIFVLVIITVQLQHFSDSLYHLLWGIPTVLVCLLEIYFLTKSLLKEPKNIDTRLSTFAISIGATTGFGIVATVINYPQLNFPYLTEVRQAGSILALLPYPFVVWALFCLKDCLTVIPEAHAIVSRGIYKYSRHPLYMAYIVWAVANSMMFPAWPVIAANILDVILLALRLQREEKLLLQTFPEYKQYYEKTGLFGFARTRKEGKELLRQQSGTIMLIVALGSIAFIGFTAIVIDIGNLYLNNVQITTEADAAALAGAQELPANPEAAKNMAISYAAQNGQANDVTNTLVSNNNTLLTVNITRLNCNSKLN